MAAPPVGWKGIILRALVANGMTQAEASEFLRDVLQKHAYDNWKRGHADGEQDADWQNTNY